MEKGTAARQATAVECRFNGSFLRRCRRRWEGFRIEIEGNDTYTVRSPGSERRRTVRLSRCGWSCTCPRALYRKFHCRHIRAAECAFLLPEPGRKEPVVLDPVPENTCPRCGADGAAKAGVRRNKNYRNQIYKCRRCERRFSANLGFEKLSAPPDVVSQAIRDYFGGKSTGEIADDLRDKLDYPPTQQTVNNWLRSFSAMAGRFCDGLDPCLGEKWRTDGMLVGVSGSPAYLHMMIDSFTRCWLSYAMTPNKATDDVSQMYRDAALAAGGPPTLLVSDGDPTYHKAWKQEYRARNCLWKTTYHHYHVHARWDINNNKMERFNGTMRAFLDRLRGFKDAGFQLLEGMRVHYNHVRPHRGLGKITPGQAAGIKVNGPKWKTLIQHAAMAEKRPG